MCLSILPETNQLGKGDSILQTLLENFTKKGQIWGCAPFLDQVMKKISHEKQQTPTPFHKNVWISAYEINDL